MGAPGRRTTLDALIAFSQAGDSKPGSTYDFAEGVARANLVARLATSGIRLLVVGPIVARLENKRARLNAPSPSPGE